MPFRAQFRKFNSERVLLLEKFSNKRGIITEKKISFLKTLKIHSENSKLHSYLIYAYGGYKMLEKPNGIMKTSNYMVTNGAI